MVQALFRLFLLEKSDQGLCYLLSPICPNIESGMTNGVCPDQTAPLGKSDLGLTICSSQYVPILSLE